MRELLNQLHRQASKDPEALARQHARRQLPKRFYKTVGVEKREDDRFAVTLDDRAVNTPARNALELPSRASALLLAKEFDEQEIEINPATMPITRLVNTAIDGVAANPEPVFEDVLRFASSDLLCYRADSPERLVQLQSEAWDPILDWARETHGAHFILGEGVVHVEQPREAINAMAVALKRHERPIALTALHSMTSLTGSAILALAAADRAFSPEFVWNAAHVDEDWNIAQWGEDYEAARRRKQRWQEMQAACKLLEAL